MYLSTANDTKIYNLSAGKSVPEWMSGNARRKLEKKNFDVRRRIQLIQDFDMPDVSHTVNVSPDGRYIFASGSYKPWLKCYDLNDLSIKFSRGLDADVVKVIVLSEDYSKVLILQEERYLELHAAFGRYFRLRMPRFGRDMVYSRESSDLFLVGASSEIYRLNLEQGEWLSPFQSQANSINCCAISDAHQLLLCGTSDGTVEAWDHRDKNRVGILDCNIPLLDYDGSNEITSICYKNALHFGVGTSSGHIQLYDLRSKKELLVKNQNNCLPIKKLDFVKRDDSDLVMSMDGRVLKMFHESDGSPFAAIETETPLNDFVRYPNSGLLFFATEAPRMLQYFVPALGTAPKWCSFLETITEELEESNQPTVYDDYKFVTKQQLDDLGMSHLIGSTVLRAYMHGYFIDARLYNKAHLLTQPFAYEKYVERKVKDIVDEERSMAIIRNKKEKLPAVNQDLMTRLRDQQETLKVKSKDKKMAEVATSILADDRFKNLFANTDFEIEEDNEQYIRQRGQKEKQNTKREELIEDEMQLDEEEPLVDVDFNAEDKNGPVEPDISDIEEFSGSGSSSDDGAEVQKEAKDQAEAAQSARSEKRRLRKERMEAERELRFVNKPKKFSLHSLGSGESSRKFLEETVLNNQTEVVIAARRRVAGKTEENAEVPFGGRELTFTMEKKGRAAREERDKKRKDEHRKQRREVARPTTDYVSRQLKKLPSNLNVSGVKKQ